MKVSSQFRHVYLVFSMWNAWGLGFGVWGFYVDSSIVDERVVVRFFLITRNKKNPHHNLKGLVNYHSA